ncbi:MAG: DUF3823 domain-containing protein, partial [Tannerella sp.]|nr:DUF3823 domain-containing protein [Tannerella sp.]
MKQINSFTAAFCAAAILAAGLASCETDNYDGPDCTLEGRVIDTVTGRPLLTEQPDGFRIRYDETSWGDNPVAQYFWARADGTFTNTRLFAGTYSVTPVEGAFVTPAAQTVTMQPGATTSVEFTVTPYISFRDVAIAPAGPTSVRVTFTLSRNVASAPLQDYRVFASSKTPYVGTIVFETAISTDAIPLTEADMDHPLTLVLENYEPGTT